ncbi:DNA polymerase III subunit gamma/tau [Alteromonas halophila]|uniref:DNA polymerase III subunit gamma/tau n=1 Tax=Alteromonas halophila TaxID=516698 RepID=A0A918JQQ0_9ALTE|nr:DNA polymerase III subunit gamma/tau [Alteromonas halophila]GGW94627.1 DNA polymerase III subunit gamma/tau [Alteromonas halophila]
MSYQVLARKWRPGKFAELVGQEHVVAAISNALDNNRLHHAYLFTGTRGVGKTTIARIFSKSLNCEQGQSAHPCGVCDTCKEIEQGNYVDLLEIDAASRTKVEDTRELLDNVQYRPTRGRFKVYLIDEVHMLSKHSFNALLKTLEEPPPHVKFLLATTDPQKLPVTILSRCLQFNLKALSREQITHQLRHILEAEAVPLESSALVLLAKAAQGSMRDALSLTDQAIAQGDGQVSQAVVTDMLGLMDRNQLLKLLHALITKTPQDVLSIVDDMAQQAPDYGQLLSELSSILHQIALTQWVPDACKLETTSARAIYQLAKSVTAEQVQLYYQIALHGKRDLPLAPDGRSALEMTLLRMMSFAPASPVSDTESVISDEPVSMPSDPQTASSEEAQAQADNPSHQQDKPPEPESRPDEETNNTLAASSAVEEEHATTSLTATPTSEGQDEKPVETETQAAGERADAPAPETGVSDEPNAQHGVEPNDYPPLSAYEDDPVTAMQDDNVPEPPVAEEEPQTPAQEEERLSNTEAMLALRQQFKKPRQGGEETSPKKPEAPETAQAEVASHIADTLSHASDHAPADTQLTPVEPIATHKTPGVPPKEVSQAESDEDTPPWDEPSSQSPPQSNVQSVPESIPAFLESGEKVLHASQIDAWSHLVEQMPIAGLLKQLALHSSFSRQDDEVVLELDQNQAHLLNESSQQQLLDALKHALGESITLKMSAGEPAVTPFVLQQQITDMRMAHAKTVVSNDDVIQSLLSTFEADVMPDSVKPR